MERSTFATALQEAVVNALIDFRRQVQGEHPYALSIILGQCGNYLGYAIATEEGLRKVAVRYASRGYRYQGHHGEQFDNLEQIAAWLRWANPDDGWHHLEFPEHVGIAPMLADLVTTGALGEDAADLEEFCTEVLAELQFDSHWLAATASECVVLGVTSGNDPRDFLLTATRANRFSVVRQLWAEYWRGEDLSDAISRYC